MDVRKGLYIVALVCLINITCDAANFYRSTTASANFNSGTCWNTTSACGTGGSSWPTTSADVVYLTCASKTTTCASSSQTCGAITLSAGTLVINSGCTLYCTSIAISGSGVLTVNGTLNISGAGSCFTISGGTFTAPPTATGLVTFSGATQNIPATTFYNLNIAGSGNKTMSGNVTVYNQLQLSANNIIVGSNTLTLGGTTYGSGSLISPTTGKIDISSGTSNLSFGGGTYDYSLGTLFSTAAPWTLASLTLMRNLATISVNGNLTITGAFTTYNGTTSTGGNLHIDPGYMVTFNGQVNMDRTCFCNKVTGSSTSDITIGGAAGQAAAIYFDLGNTAAGGTNTIRNFTLNRTGMTFYPLSSVRIGNLLTLAASTKFSVANNTSVASLNTLTFDGTGGNSWTGSGEFVGSSNLTSAYIYIYGSGSLSTPLKFNTSTASNYTLTGLTIQRTGSPVLQLATNLNILSSIVFKYHLTTYGSLDINGKIIDMGASGIIYNENSSESVFCSVCPANSTASYISANLGSLAASTTYTGTSGDPEQTGYRGLGLDITTDATAPGATTIKRGFSERSGYQLTKSVLRYFEINPTTNTNMNATLGFHFWDSETNTLNKTILTLYRDSTGANDWVNKNGTSTPGIGFYDNKVSLSGIPEFSPWTAGERCIGPAPTTSGSVCESGTVALNLSSATPPETYYWYSSSSGGSVVNSGNTYTPSISSTTSYWVEMFNTTSKCRSGRTEVVATVNTLAPTTGVTISSDPAPPIPDNTSVTLTANTSSPFTPPLIYQWTKDGADIPGETNSTYTFTSSGTASYNCTVKDYANCIKGNNDPLLLPIELLFYTATVNSNNDVDVKWATSSEANNDYFTIERSSNGVEFIPLARIKGAGNSNTNLNYAYTDENPFIGTSYYRLKQTDFDGQFEIFDPVAVTINKNKTFTYAVYPNPASNMLYLSYENAVSGATAEITDILGNIIFSQSLETSDQLKKIIIDLGDYRKGIYFVKVASGGSSSVKKVIVQ